MNSTLQGHLLWITYIDDVLKFQSLFEQIILDANLVFNFEGKKMHPYKFKPNIHVYPFHFTLSK